MRVTCATVRIRRRPFMRASLAPPLTAGNVHAPLRMKKIVAISRPSKLEDVKKVVLAHPWIAGLTVTEVKGHGRQRGHEEVYRGAEYAVDLVPKLKVEIVVPDPLVPRVLDDLARSLRTGRIGDGKLFVDAVDEAIRIRTGERGEPAL